MTGARTITAMMLVRDRASAFDDSWLSEMRSIVAETARHDSA